MRVLHATILGVPTSSWLDWTDEHCQHIHTSLVLLTTSHLRVQQMCASVTGEKSVLLEFRDQQCVVLVGQTPQMCLYDKLMMSALKQARQEVPATP